MAASMKPMAEAIGNPSSRPQITAAWNYASMKPMAEAIGNCGRNERPVDLCRQASMKPMAEAIGNVAVLASIPSTRWGLNEADGRSHREHHVLFPRVQDRPDRLNEADGRSHREHPYRPPGTLRHTRRLNEADGRSHRELCSTALCLKTGSRRPQ